MAELDPRRAAWVPYIADLIGRMHLMDWEVRLSDEHPTIAGAVAQVGVTYGRKLARVYLSEAFLRSEPGEQRNTIVHELVHIHLDMTASYALDQLGREGGAALRVMFENAVDALAGVIAPHMPLPPAAKAASSRKGRRN